MNTDRRKLTPDSARRLTIDAEPWLSCDDCFHLIDQYIELVLSAGDADMPAMRAHLTGCGACGEEARSLLLLVAAEEGIDPAPALRRLTAG